MGKRQTVHRLGDKLNNLADVKIERKHESKRVFSPFPDPYTHVMGDTPTQTPHAYLDLLYIGQPAE